MDIIFIHSFFIFISHLLSQHFSIICFAFLSLLK
nr:MAG TPA: hypothetical protein [Caudoviricetes sp.]DAX52646.1 MAG TPA: hypothetical protein [Caudoviricetes sp.]